jgi:HSP20 family protein
MTMVRWDPWSDVFNLHSDVSRLMNDTRGGGVHSGTAALPVDIRQTDGEFLVEASVPGFAPEEVEVTLDRGVLTIRGEHRTESETEGRYLRRERSQHSFFRQLSLPKEVRADGITASFGNGVLTVRVPRIEAPAPRRIQIDQAPVGLVQESVGPAGEQVPAITQS